MPVLGIVSGFSASEGNAEVADPPAHPCSVSSSQGCESDNGKSDENRDVIAPLGANLTASAEDKDMGASPELELRPSPSLSSRQGTDAIQRLKRAATGAALTKRTVFVKRADSSASALDMSQPLGSLLRRGGARARASIMQQVDNLNKSPQNQRASTRATVVLKNIDEVTHDFRDQNGAGDGADLDVLLEREGGEGVRTALIDAGSPLHILLIRVMRIEALLSVILAPYLLAFQDHFGGVDRQSPTASELWYVLLGDVIYGLGIFFQFFVSQVQIRTGKEIVSLAKIRENIISSPTFWLDMVAMLAFVTHILEITTSYFLFSRSSGHKRSMLGLLFGQVRLFRGWRLLSSGVKRLQSSRSTQWTVFFELADLVLLTCILTHLSACIWFITRGEPPEGERSPYIQSVFEAAFLMMGQERPRSGRNTDAERLMTMMLGLVGYMYMAYFLAALFNAVGQQRVLETMIGQKMALVHAALQSLQIPEDLQKRIVRYHDFVNVHHSPEAYDALFSGLSVPLLTELKLCLFRDLIEKADFFQRCPAKQVTRVVQVLEELIFSPGDLVLRKGECDAPAMYFIIRGHCELLGDQGFVLGSKTSGDYFGEVSLLLPDHPRACWARAKTYSIVARLTKADFDMICGSTPAQFRHVLENLLGYDWIDRMTRQRANEVLDQMIASKAAAEQDGGPTKASPKLPDAPNSQEQKPLRSSHALKKFQKVARLGLMMRLSGSTKAGIRPEPESGARRLEDVAEPIKPYAHPLALPDSLVAVKPILDEKIRRVMREEVQVLLDKHQADLRRLLSTACDSADDTDCQSADDARMPSRS